MGRYDPLIKCGSKCNLNPSCGLCSLNVSTNMCTLFDNLTTLLDLTPVDNSLSPVTILSKTKLLTCLPDYYYDVENVVCFLKKLFGESCLNPDQCFATKGLNCINSTCNCTNSTK